MVAAPAERPLKFEGHAALGMHAAGWLMLVGSIVDLLVLWGLQRQSVPQWEFVALSNTANALPRFGIAFGFFFAALAIARSTSLVAYRVLAGGMILIGLFSAALGALMATAYLALHRVAQLQPEALVTLQSTLVKTLAVSGTAALLFLVVGILTARRPRR